MSIIIQPLHAYAFLAGLYIGKFTNFFSDFVITGLILYIVTPQIYTQDRFERAKRWCWSWFEKKPVAIEMSQLNFTEDQKTKLLEQNLSNYDFQSIYAKLPKIEVVNSPKYKL